MRRKDHIKRHRIYEGIKNMCTNDSMICNVTEVWNHLHPFNRSEWASAWLIREVMKQYARNIYPQGQYEFYLKDLETPNDSRRRR